MTKRIFILIAFVVVVFSPCLQAEFLSLDDDVHITANAAVGELSFNSIRQAFTQVVNKTYIPLTTLSFAVEKHFFGFNPFVFHLDNLLLYILIVVLVFLLAQRLGLSGEAAFWAALIFAIHPMKVESVAWATERKDMLYALFYLLALYHYWSYLKTSSMKYYLLTCVWGFLSILSKPMALSLPLILLLVDWFYGRSLNKKAFMEKIPIFAYIMGISLVTYAMNMHEHHGSYFQQGSLIGVWSLAFYIYKFLFPFQVFPSYVLPKPVSLFCWPYLLSLLFDLGLLGLLVRFRKHKLFIFAFLYFFLSTFFLFRSDERYFHVVADRFMFLPGMGICFLAGSWAGQRTLSRGKTVILYIILVLMGIRTNLQCQMWHDSITFWSGIIEAHPTFRAFNNRGVSYFKKGQDDLALHDFNMAIAAAPDGVKAYNNRGYIYYLRYQDKKAMDDFNKAITLDPDFAGAYMNRSILQKDHHHYREALQDALKARQLGWPVDAAYIQRLQRLIN